MDLWSLYALMKKSRVFEEAVAQLWKDGLISGEMHLGTGEEAIIAGVVSQLLLGDAMALDHRGTAPLLMRGVDDVLLLKEMLGKLDGLCGGRGGHMHLFSKAHLAASSGIVGSSGPAAVGFALAAQYLRPGTVAVAFFGEGAMNQGMLMESLNLASVWKLPVIFVCKDDQWAITTRSATSAAGDMGDRVRGLGVPYLVVNGLDVREVWQAANPAIERARQGKGPTFLRASCVHLEAHFLGLISLRVIRHPLKELPAITKPLFRSFVQPGGGSLGQRLAGSGKILSSIREMLTDSRENSMSDPFVRVRVMLRSDPERLEELDAQVQAEISAAVAIALNGGEK